ncbi:unnamed protein product [Mytilus coruscus]|uniref:C1q domain-containing protein n=1 Tax=Mytilus coruscus TaxID=42192 RepID=A0A6J8EQW7_MYTCO|nr:unnamed protein product [Mytilus coruscus]
MIRGCAIVLFILFLIENVCSNTCGHDNCETTIDIPLKSKLNEPLEAELDISSITTRLKEIIRKEVKKAVNDLVENIVDKAVQTGMERLQTSINVGISSFRQNIEENISATEINDSLTIIGKKLDEEIEHLKGKQHFTESKLSVVESEVKRTTENGYHTYTYDGNEIIKFSAVKLSNGIENVKKFISSGTFTCEKQGIYLVGVYILSYTRHASFVIMKNGIIVSIVYVRPALRSTNSNYHTGTGIIAVQLNANDTLNIKSGYYKMQVYGRKFSCLTVIKVK